MSVSLDLLKHYPWLPSLEKYYAEVGAMDPVDFIKEAFSRFPSGELEQRISNLFQQAFDNRETISNYRADDINIYMYLIVKLLLYILNNKPIINRIANLYSKQTYQELIEDNSDADLYDICKDLNLNINYYESPVKFGVILRGDQRETLKTNFTLHYIDYLKLASSLRDASRKLVNNALLNGYAFIEKRALIRLLQEHVRKKLTIELETDSKVLKGATSKFLKIKKFGELYQNILDQWDLKKEDFEYSFELKFKEGSDIANDFPPCVKEILSKIQEGQNIIHIERLFLVFFLHALNYPNDKIVDLFANLPDFDRKMTEYQVEFAKKKGYVPHSCATLKSFNLCKAKKYDDELCMGGFFSRKLEETKKIAHPLFYVQFKQFTRSKSQNQNEPKTEKTDS